jgi:hypothetical protein
VNTGPIVGVKYRRDVIWSNPPSGYPCALCGRTGSVWDRCAEHLAVRGVLCLECHATVANSAIAETHERIIEYRLNCRACFYRDAPNPYTDAVRELNGRPGKAYTHEIDCEGDSAIVGKHARWLAEAGTTIGVKVGVKVERVREAARITFWVPA